MCIAPLQSGLGWLLVQCGHGYFPTLLLTMWHLGSVHPQVVIGTTHVFWVFFLNFLWPFLFFAADAAADDAAGAADAATAAAAASEAVAAEATDADTDCYCNCVCCC